MTEVEQLWYTWTAHGLSRAPGFQVRAASDGLCDVAGSRYAALKPFLSYALPAGASGEPADAPQCLALLEAGPERALIRTVYLGLDRHGRPGNFFAHALVGGCDALSLALAVGSWGAGYWRVSDQDLPAAELRLPSLPLAEQTPDPAWRPGIAGDHLRYVLAAVLSLRPGRHLYLAAEPEQVVNLLEGVTRALPRLMQRQLTFSTYERDVLRSPAMIVGTCWRGSRDRREGAATDLPDTCYQQGPALNCLTGRHTDLPNGADLRDYVEFAANCLERGDASALRAFLDLADAAQTAATPGLLRAYAWSQVDAFAEDRIDELLGDPAQLAVVLPRPTARALLLRAFAATPERWRGELGSALRRLRAAFAEPPGAVAEALAAFAEEAMEAALRCIAAGDSAAPILLVDELAVAAHPAADGSRCHRLFARLAIGAPETPAPLPWEMQRRLLLWAARADPPPSAGQLFPFLRVSWSRLPQLMALPLPDLWLAMAVEQAIVAGEPGPLPPELAGLIEVHVEAVSDAVLWMVKERQHRERAAAFVVQLAQTGSPAYLPLVERLLRSGIYAPTFFAEIAEPLPYKDVETLLAFIEQHTRALLATGMIGPGSTTLLARYLEGMSPRRCATPPTRRALRQLSGTLRAALADNLARPLDAWEVLAAFLAQPEAQPATLDRLARAIQELSGDGLAGASRPGRQRDAALLQTLARALAPVVGTAEQLCLTLERLGSTVAGGSCALLRQLYLALPREDPQQWVRRQAVYISTGMTWARPPCRMEDAVKDEIRRMDQTTLQAVNQALREPRAPCCLPPRQLKEWQRWIDVVRPPSPLQRVQRKFSRG